MDALPYKISALVYLHNRQGELLLMRRNKAPNKGLWSPIGGKLEMPTGESPHDAACREVMEEIGLTISPADLHLFAMIAEKNYEDRCHWLMFLFDCRKQLDALPTPIDEGSFAFFPEAEVLDLDLPDTDRKALWKVYFKARHDFVALKADCSSEKLLQIVVDEAMELKHPDSK